MFPAYVASVDAAVELLRTTLDSWASASPAAVKETLIPAEGPRSWAAQVRYVDVPGYGGAYLTIKVTIDQADPRSPVRTGSYSLQARLGQGHTDRLLWRLCNHKGEEAHTGGRPEHLHLGDDSVILPSPILTWSLFLDGLEAAARGRVPDWR